LVLSHDHPIPNHTDLGISSESEGHLYGFVFFRQRKDANVKRGYFQKSLVLLTQRPWLSLFHQLMKIVGPMFMDAVNSSPVDGTDPSLGYIPLLEAFCFNVASW
jgi:hypothetical protein